jgi:recombination protein RecR
MSLPSHIEQLIAHFSSLPGVGQKTAERLVFYLLKQDRAVLKNFAESMLGILDRVGHCAVCGQFSEEKLCPICSNPRRDHSIICVVAEEMDISSLEKAGEFKGLYHVLGNVLSPTEGITPDRLNIKNLLARSATIPMAVKEIILALNPTIEGETTCLYLTKLIKNSAPQIKITKLARGLPQGGDLEYADEITLANAFRGRTIV